VFVDLLAVILLQHPVTATWGLRKNGMEKEKLMTEAKQGMTVEVRKLGEEAW
jgi:hypothetical protein